MYWPAVGPAAGASAGVPGKVNGGIAFVAVGEVGGFRAGGAAVPFGAGLQDFP